MFQCRCGIFRESKVQRPAITNTILLVLKEQDVKDVRITELRNPWL